ncbi:MAG: hypothetical protein QXU98_04205 [Candidatus Parvarchaeota archaeon]
MKTKKSKNLFRKKVYQKKVLKKKDKDFIKRVLSKNEKEIKDKKLRGSLWSVFNGNKELLHLKANQGTSNLYQLLYSFFTGSNTYFPVMNNGCQLGIAVSNYNGSAVTSFQFNGIDNGSTTWSIAYQMSITTLNNGTKTAIITSGSYSSTATSLIGNFGIINSSQTTDTITSIQLNLISPGDNSEIMITEQLTNINVSIPYNPSASLTITQQISV